MGGDPRQRWRQRRAGSRRHPLRRCVFHGFRDLDRHGLDLQERRGNTQHQQFYGGNEHQQGHLDQWRDRKRDDCQLDYPRACRERHRRRRFKRDDVFRRNSVRDNTESGIQIYNSSPSITGNTVTANTGYGMYVYGLATPAAVSANMLDGNTAGPIGVGANSSLMMVDDDNVFPGLFTSRAAACRAR
ncbi:MAG: right-handed parallel beta-helix repeat-containing protein [Betaproteobacteria bacterium]|nr:right-handed parallel beta-helix repeat-containing protein [Betaproteobacteria bacterium]